MSGRAAIEVMARVRERSRRDRRGLLTRTAVIGSEVWGVRASPGGGAFSLPVVHAAIAAFVSAQGDRAVHSALSQSLGVHDSLAIAADSAASGSEVGHDPERPCREAEAPIQG